MVFFYGLYYAGLVVYCKYLVFQCGFSVIGVCTVITSCVSYRYRTFGILAEEEHFLLCWEYSFGALFAVLGIQFCDCEVCSLL